MCAPSQGFHKHSGQMFMHVTSVKAGSQAEQMGTIREGLQVKTDISQSETDISQSKTDTLHGCSC